MVTSETIDFGSKEISRDFSKLQHFKFLIFVAILVILEDAIDIQFQIHES
jgi:hypothetical protein